MNKLKKHPEIENFQHQAQFIDEIFQINVKGVSHEDSLMQPEPAGNCMNWIVGHLLWTYSYNLPVLGKEPEIEEEKLKQYARNSSPIESADEVIHFTKLIRLWNRSTAQWISGLTQLTLEELDQPAKRFLEDKTKENLRSRISGVLIHQSYHIGQIGILRRLAGKPGTF